MPYPHHAHFRISSAQDAQDAHLDDKVLMVDLLIKGNFAHCRELNDGLEILDDYIIGVGSGGKEGSILFVEESSKLGEMERKFCFEADNVENYIRLKEKGEILIPGLVDTHTHAPQYPNCGTGTDKELLDWLECYTFPTESKYSDTSFAQNIYSNVVRKSIQHGTTTCAYFGTIHKDSCLVLSNIVAEKGQRAWIGKVCMDRNSPPSLQEDTQTSLRNTESFLQSLIHENQGTDSLVVPALTPRFVPTCSMDLMKGLSSLACQYSLPMQSHVSENLKEVDWVADLHKESPSYSDVYREAGIIQPTSMQEKKRKPTVLAHGIYLTDSEIDMLSACHGATISHCPSSNFNLRSGILDVRRLTKAGIPIGLGTDASGGESLSMWNAMHSCITASTALYFARQGLYSASNGNPDDGASIIDYREAFALGTLGGSCALGIDDIVGNFLPGKSFDGVIVSALTPGSSIDIHPEISTQELLSKFVYLANRHNVSSVFVGGKCIHNAL